MKKVLIITRDPLMDFRQLPHGKNLSIDNRYAFYINAMDENPDFVVVMGKGLREERDFPVPRERTILITGEPYSILAYPKGYCQQYGLVCSCQPEIKGENVIYTPAILPWFVGVTFGNNGTHQFSLDYECIRDAQSKKTKLISVISSTKALSKGHVDRLRFIKKLQERYGDKVDIFGHGFHDFSDKWDVLAPYQYHIVIENSTSDYYWTEKIADCFLAGTYPFYHGCTNITDYFPKETITPIDIRNFDQTMERIEQGIHNHLYEQRVEALQKAKMLVLDQYNVFTQIVKVCEHLERDNTKGQTILRPASRFPNIHNLWLHTVGRNYYKLMSKV